MKKRYQIYVLLVLLVILAGRILYVRWPAPVPLDTLPTIRLAAITYEGRTLGDWLSDLDIRGEWNDRTSPDRKERAGAAIRAIGTHALPSLVGLLSLHSTGGQKFGGEDLRVWQERATRAFEALGPMAEPALPELTNILVSPNNRYQFRQKWFIAEAIVHIGSTGVESLIRALACPDSSAREASARALGIGKSETHAKPAIPALIACLTDGENAVRNAAAWSLGLIMDDSALWVMTLIDKGQNPGEVVVSYRLFVNRKHRSPEEFNGVHLKHLEHTNRYVQVAAAIGLAGWKEAEGLPAVQRVLMEALKDADTRIHEPAGKALKLIDPVAAAKVGIK